MNQGGKEKERERGGEREREGRKERPAETPAVIGGPSRSLRLCGPLQEEMRAKRDRERGRERREVSGTGQGGRRRAAR